MVQGVRAGTHSKRWRVKVPDCSSCNAKTAGTRRSAHKQDGKKITKQREAINCI